MAFPYFLPYASYHEASGLDSKPLRRGARGSNWRPPFFAKLFRLVAGLESSRDVAGRPRGGLIWMDPRGERLDRGERAVHELDGLQAIHLESIQQNIEQLIDNSNSKNM